MDRIDIRGILFDNVTKDEALELIDDRVRSFQKTSVFTPNSEIVQACVENEEIKNIISSADIILPDGVGIIKASKILETPLKEKVPGVEIGERLFEKYANTSHSFFILGGQKESSKDISASQKAAERMSGKYNCHFAGWHHGYFDVSNEENDDVISKINSSGADILYVCLGSPSQEKWISENREKLEKVVLIMALGGSVDIYAGNLRRAPALFINLGIEWLWRLIRQPSRIVRMMKLPKFYIGVKKYKKDLDKSKK